MSINPGLPHSAPCFAKVGLPDDVCFRTCCLQSINRRTVPVVEASQAFNGNIGTVPLNLRGHLRDIGAYGDWHKTGAPLR